MRASKMSGEEAPLEETKLTNHSSRVSLINSTSSVNYMTQDILYIGESDLGSKSETGRGVICEKPSRRKVKKP